MATASGKGFGQGREHNKRQPSEHTDQEDEAETACGLSIHDLDRSVARDCGEGDCRESGVAHHVKNRRRSVNATETAARCRSHHEGPPYDNNEADVEHPGRARHNRPADRQRRNADERLHNSDRDRGGRFGG